MFLTKVRPDWKCIHSFKKRPFVHYNLKTFGILHPIPYDFMKSYNDLPPDKYLLDSESRIDTCPESIVTRSRRYAKLTIDVQDNYEYSITKSNCTTFEQNVDDSRSCKRDFEPMEIIHVWQPWLLEFITQITALSVLNHNYYKGNQPIKNADVHIHQVRQTSYMDVDAHNSPEGIHRDGADYIVSAFVINRYNIEGGESIIYNKNKQTIYKTILEDKEGIYQEDIDQWHYVTPISTFNEGLGFRDILGVDITLNTYG